PSDISERTIPDSSSHDLSRIRAALGSEATLLEYFAIRGQLFLALVTPETVRFIPLGLSSSVLRRMRMLQFQLSKLRLDPDYIKRFEVALLQGTQDHLQALYNEVVRPAESLLQGRHLVIVPFGQLHSLPFHALFTGQEYLIDRFTISYAPSASIF